MRDEYRKLKRNGQQVRKEYPHPGETLILDKNGFMF